MSLQSELAAQLDTGSLMAGLTGELGGAGGDLGAISVDLSAGDVGAAADVAGAIDLSELGATVAEVEGVLAGLTGALPVTDDLIAPIRAGLAAVDTLVAGTLEADIRAALDGAAEEFGALGDGGALAALRRLAETLSGTGELSALREGVEALIGLAAPGTVPSSSLDDALAGVFSMLDAIGAMMTLETLLGEARRLGDINAGRLPAGRAEDLIAAVEAEIAAAGAALDGIDPDDTAAVDAAVAALALCRTSIRTLLEALREGMATGEATLTLIDPSGLLARVEAVLVRLRGTALADVQDAATALSAKLQPFFAFDLGGANQFTLDGLLTEVEGRVAEIAGLLGSFDTGILTAPIETALGTVTGVAEDVSGGIEAVLGAVTDALAGIRDAIKALPLDAVANALGGIVGTIADALATLADLLGSVEDLIGDGAAAAQAALERAEAAVTAFRDDIEAAFAAARDFIDGLGIDDAIGTVADAIQTVSDAIGQADMAPYFATAEDAVGTAADVIDKVPFNLLPDSMEQEVVDLVRPIKAVDLDAFADEIRTVLQINPDGTFSLRPDLEAAVQTIQDKIDALQDSLGALDPRQLIAPIDAALADVATEIEAIEPSVALTPLSEALDTAKSAVARIDLDAVLQPLRDGFDAVVVAVDSVQPATLLEPVEAEIAATRAKVLEVTRLETWRATVDDLETQILDLAATLDPAALEEPFRDAFEEARTRILNGQLPDPLVPLGALVGGLLSGAGEAVAAQAMVQVASWLRGAAAGAQRLEGAAHAVQGAIASVRGVVAGIDPDAIATRIGTGLDPLAATVAALPAGAGRDRLAAAVAAVDLSADLRLLGPGRDRYLAFLETSETTLGDLVAKGFGEIDSSAGAIRAALAPFASLLASPRAVLERFGFTRFDGGLTGLLAEMFEAASPERLTGLLIPIYAALHDRLGTLIAAILDPVRAFIDSLIGIISLFDLAPITALLDEIFQPVRDEIAALHPDQLLGEAITAFTDAQAAFAAFDPLAPVIDLIETLQATIVRVLDLFDAESLLAVPIEVYDTIREILEALDLNGLLDPLYDRLDAIALQVTEGLDTTVAAFERLQDALPDTIGSTSVSGSVSVGAG